MLLVEDECELRSVIALLIHSLEIFSFVVEARDGKEAIQKMTNQKFDLIIIDLNMPKLGGLELSRYIKQDQKLAGTSIIIMSGMISGKDVQELKNIGVTSILTKPVGLIKLRETISKALKPALLAQF